MVNQKLLNYIRLGESKGYSIQQLRTALIQQGYAQNEVDESIKAAHYSTQQLSDTSSSQPKNKSNKLLLFLVPAIILLIIAGIFFFINLDKVNSEGDGNIINIESKDKSSGIVYSKLTLQIPKEAFKTSTVVKIVALAATPNDKFVGGAYMISPKDIELQEPATVSITYFDEAVSTYNKDISDSELTLAYFDKESFEYIPLESTYDKESKTVTGKISKLYGEGITLITKLGTNPSTTKGDTADTTE